MLKLLNLQHPTLPTNMMISPTFTLFTLVTLASAALAALAPLPNLPPHGSILCYDPRYATEQPVLDACISVVGHDIVTSPLDNLRRLNFSRRPIHDDEFLVPHTWAALKGGCKVVIDIPELPGRRVANEESSFGDVKRAAVAVMAACVTRKPNLGGITQIGKDLNLQLHLLTYNVDQAADGNAGKNQALMDDDNRHVASTGQYADLDGAPNDHGDGQTPPVYRVYKRRWFGLMQLVLMNIIVSWDWLSYSPVANTAAAYFSTTSSVINWLSTAFLFAFVVASPFTIYALHIGGPRLALMTSSLLILVGNWIRYAGTRASPPNFAVVMFGQILIGLAQPFVLSAPTHYSSLWFSPRGR
ncbi:MAG: hypothetical protein Q9170_008163, partial [Blastenia crenularia]